MRRLFSRTPSPRTLDGRASRSWLVCGLLVVLQGIGIAGVTSAQVALLPEELEQTDVIGIELDRRDLFAFDGLSGRRSKVRLEIGEEVLFEKTRGRIGLVLTDRRVLGVAPGTGFRELRLRLQETPPTIGLVENEIALVVTDRRALAFTPTGRWVEESFSPNEWATALRAGASAAVVITNRRALGTGAELVSFVSESLRVKEDLENVTTHDTLITLRTERRILVFSGPRGRWLVERRRIR